MLLGYLGNIKMELSIWISLINHIGRLERMSVISLAAEFFTTCSRDILDFWNLFF
jgi:hypothetical protein